MLKDLFIVLFLTCMYSNIHAQHDVKIKVKVENVLLKELRISDFNYVLQKDTVYSKAKISNDGNFYFTFKLNKPTHALLLNNQIFLTPVDDIFIVLNKENTITEVSGINKINYQFYTLLKTRFDSKMLIFKNDYKNDLSLYKKILTDDYHNKLLFVDSLDKKGIFTPAFRAYIKTELAYLLLDRLLFRGGLPPSKNLPTGYLSNNPNDYFNQFNYDEIIHAKVLNKWVDYFNDTIPEKMDAIKYKFDYSLKKLKGCDQEIIQMMALRDIWMNDINNVSLFDSLYVIAIQHIMNPIFKQELLYMNSFFHLINQPLSSLTLDATLRDTLGNLLTFKEILQRNKGKVLYIDFWATWCAPCIAELPNLLKLSQDYRSEGLDVLSISVDSDWNDWMNYKKKYKLVNQQYWLMGDFKSDLAKAIHLGAIPRHIIVSDEGNLISLYPSKPNDAIGFRRNFERIKQMFGLSKSH